MITLVILQVHYLEDRLDFIPGLRCICKPNLPHENYSSNQHRNLGMPMVLSLVVAISFFKLFCHLLKDNLSLKVFLACSPIH